jgi:hypothetical protein
VVNFHQLLTFEIQIAVDSSPPSLWNFLQQISITNFHQNIKEILAAVPSFSPIASCGGWTKSQQFWMANWSNGLDGKVQVELLRDFVKFLDRPLHFEVADPT